METTQIQNNTVYPLGDNIGYIQLINKHENPLLSVVNAARVSYNTQKIVTDDRDKKLVKFLWENSHSSPLRHQFYTFRIKFPLFVARQAHKHQVGAPWFCVTGDGEEVELDFASIQMDTDSGTSFNEISGRYVKLDPEFYIPLRYRSNVGHANKQVSSELQTWRDEDHKLAYERFTEKSLDAYRGYQEELNYGVAKEMARMLLPQNIYTSAIWSPSLQAIIHFLQQRLKPDAQWEIRQYAEAVKTLIATDLESLGIEF